LSGKTPGPQDKCRVNEKMETLGWVSQNQASFRERGEKVKRMRVKAQVQKQGRTPKAEEKGRRVRQKKEGGGDEGQGPRRTKREGLGKARVQKKRKVGNIISKGKCRLLGESGLFLKGKKKTMEILGKRRGKGGCRNEKKDERQNRGVLTTMVADVPK